MVQSLVVILSISIIAQALDVVDLWFQSQLASKKTVIAKNLVIFVTTLVKICLILLKSPLSYFILVVCLELILHGIALFCVYRFNQKKISLGLLKFVTTKEILMNGLPLMFSSVAMIIYMKIDQIMLGEIISIQEVGTYSAAASISRSWYFVPTTIASSVFPSILNYKEKDENKYYKKLQQLFIIVVAISYFVAIICTLFSHQIVNLLFGSGYHDSEIILSLHIWGGIFISLGVIRGLWINAENIRIFLVFSTVVGAVINIILNNILIPVYQGIGASIATVFSCIIASFLLGFAFRKTRKITFNMTKSLLFMM